jgi:hypothetical protein
LLVRALEPAKLAPQEASPEQLRADAARAKEYSRQKVRVLAARGAQADDETARLQRCSG